MSISGYKENKDQIVNSDYLQIHNRLTVVDGHSDLMADIYRRHQSGEKAVFLNKYAEKLKRGGVNCIILNTGGDTKSMNAGSDDPLWGTLKKIHCVFKENEESGEVVSLCTSPKISAITIINHS